MALFTAFNINASGLTAERYRMDIVSQNLANAKTTRTTDARTPYRRKLVTFQEKAYGVANTFGKIFRETSAANRNRALGAGVKVATVYEDTQTDFKKVYDPSHPDADDDGYVLYPNVDTVTEMVDLIDASRAYEANATAFTASKAMITQALQMGR